jgi:type VI secretion system protein ImpC
MATPEQNPAAQAAEAEATTQSLLDQIVDEGRFGKETEAQQRGRDMIKAFVKDVLEGAVTYSADTEAMLNQQIAEIDRLVSAQLNAVMHHEKFQKLEATWTGLRFLIANTETGPMLKVRVLPVTKKELLRDLTAGRAAMGVDRSELFRKVYQEEYNVFGGNPYGSLVGDFEFDKTGQDIKLLEALSKVAAAAHAPFISGTAPEMFGFESFTELNNMYQLSGVFEGSEYAQWRAFRESEDSRYVALTAPRMLLREPFGKKNPIDAFDFEEDVSGKEHHRYLWGNAAWGLAARVNTAFAQHGWCARIRGVMSGGKVEGLPVHTFETDSGDVAMKCPTETVIPDDHEMELAKLGFAPLANEKNSPNAVFFSVQSAQKPKEYVGTGGDAATANAAISAQLPYIFAVSRFAHYLKVMMRDYIGSYKTKGELQKMLQNWIGEYVLKSEGAPEDAKAKKPLSDARIDVIENPRAPGTYQAVAYLKPHFQLDAVDFSLRLVADVPEQ